MLYLKIVELIACHFASPICHPDASLRQTQGKLTSVQAAEGSGTPTHFRSLKIFLRLFSTFSPRKRWSQKFKENPNAPLDFPGQRTTTTPHSLYQSLIFNHIVRVITFTTFSNAHVFEVASV